MTTNNRYSRRQAIELMIGGSLSFMTLPGYGNSFGQGTILKGNVRHSVSKWCFKYPLEEFCKEIKKIGIESVELVGPKKWPVIQKNGLECAIANFEDLSPERGFNNLQWHESLIRNYKEVIPLASKAGIKNLICYSGNLAENTDQQGFDNCRKILHELIPVAEQHNITLTMELIGKEFPDYQCNNIKWGVKLCDNIQSENFKLLYDIAHMFSTGADIYHDITNYHKYIAHYQIAGAPNRCEPDMSKEFDCKKVLATIMNTGYKGFIGQEYWPSKELDRMERLKDCINFCDV